MAQAKAKRVPKVYPEEQKIETQLETYAKIKEPTDAQKANAKTLRQDLGKLRFVRLAKQRVPKALKALDSIGKLAGSGYGNTAEQADKITKALQQKLDAVTSKLAGEKVATAAFDL